jgi:hypothetical protein
LISSSVSKLKTLRMPMAATPPSDPKPAGDDRNLVPVDVSSVMPFEDRLYLFWQKYRGLVLAGCALIFLVIIGKGAWDYMARQKELETQRAYASATTTEQLKAFSSSYSGHVLAGVAQLRIADEAYAVAKSAEAVAAYGQAVSILGDGALAGRAQLGLALAKIQSGDTAGGTTELKQLANDAKLFKAIRTEAAYHLTSLAVEAGNSDEAQKLSDQLMQIDPTSPWTQRGLELRASLPVSPVASAPSTENAGGIQITVPKK